MVYRRDSFRFFPFTLSELYIHFVNVGSYRIRMKGTVSLNVIFCTVVNNFEEKKNKVPCK